MANPEIKVKIGADAKDLDAGLDKAGASLAKFAKVGAAAASAVAVAMVALTKASLAQIDVLAKQARSLGLTTEAFQKMTMVAGEAGVEAGALSSMLGLMQRNIVELSKGTALQVEAFGQLGLSIEDLQSLSPDEQFAKIAEALNGIADPAQKTATAMDIFGRSGRAAINMLEDYSAKANEAAEFQRKFGIAVSQDTTANVEAANDAVGRLTMVMTGLGNVMAGAVAPSIKAAADALLGYIANANAAIQATRVLGAEGLELSAIEKDLFNTAIANSDMTAIAPPGARWDLPNFPMAGSDGSSGPLSFEPVENAPTTRPMRPSVDSFSGASTSYSGGGGGTGGGMTSRVQMLLDSLQTEREIIADWHAESLETLSTALETEMLTREEYNQAIERLEQEHQERLAGIREMGNEWGVSSVLQGGADILNAMGSVNKKALKVAKVFGAAQAWVDTLTGAAAELKKGTFGFASAAAVIAKGAAFVAAIKGVSDSGGTSGTGGGGSSSGTTQAASQPTTTFAFTIQNDPMGFGESFARQLIDQLNTTSRNGGNIRGVLA
jgi:hypothetical protein